MPSHWTLSNRLLFIHQDMKTPKHTQCSTDTINRIKNVAACGIILIYGGRTPLSYSKHMTDRFSVLYSPDILSRTCQTNFSMYLLISASSTLLANAFKNIFILHFQENSNNFLNHTNNHPQRGDLIVSVKYWQ